MLIDWMDQTWCFCTHNPYSVNHHIKQLLMTALTFDQLTDHFGIYSFTTITSKPIGLLSVCIHSIHPLISLHFSIVYNFVRVICTMAIFFPLLCITELTRVQCVTHALNLSYHFKTNACTIRP